MAITRTATDPQIRPIRPADDAAMAAIIREVMTTFGAFGPGYSINDPEVDAMSAHYAKERAAFFVVEESRRVLGGGGIGPLTGAPADTCELRKMYFLPQLRGRGLGKKLLCRCLDAARERGYRRCYLETLIVMESAQKFYLKSGFRQLQGALGATGHSGCNRFYLLEL